MKILARAHDVIKADPKTLAKEIKEKGYDGVQLVLYKALDKTTAIPFSTQYSIEEISNAFKENNLIVGMLGAYFNPVHSNKELVKDCISRFKQHLSFSKAFNTKYVGSETGSYNDDKWTYNEKNRTEEAYNTVKNVFSQLLDYAKEVDSNIALEGAYGHCIYEPKLLKKLYDEINNGHLFITLDVFNYLHIGDYSTSFQHTLVDDTIKYFNQDVKIYHLKDFIVDKENNKLVQVGLGEGLMDLDYIIKNAVKYTPNALLVFEGCPKDKIESSITYIKQLLNKYE